MSDSGEELREWCPTRRIWTTGANSPISESEASALEYLEPGMWRSEIHEEKLRMTRNENGKKLTVDASCRN